MGLDWIWGNHLKESIPTVNIQQVASICNFIQALLTPQNGFRDKLKLDEKKKFINSVFAFSYAWGMGGSL